MITLHDEVKYKIEKLAEQSSEIGAKLLKAYQTGPDNIERLYAAVTEGMISTERLYKRLVELQGNLFTAEKYEYYPVQKEIIIQKEDDVYHFILSELLPHRIMIDEHNKTLRYNYNRNIFYSGYRRAVLEYVNEHPVEIFNEKVTLLVINHVSHEHANDNDNVEIKTITDAMIKGIFIKDDAPQYLSLHMDAVIDDKNYTEMYLGRFIDLLPKML